MIDIKKILYNMNDYIKSVFVLTIIGCICYLPLIANSYNNSSDGLWHSSHYQAGNWELSIGGWAWLFLDKIREGYAAEPFNSLLTLILLSTAMTMLFYNHKRQHYIFMLLVVISTVTCCFLSYRYMSPTFGLSVLLSVCAAKLTIMQLSSDYSRIMNCFIWISIIGLLTLTLGLYQANIGCYCIIVLFNILIYLNEDKPDFSIKLILRSILAFIISCMAYKVIWDIGLKLRHIEASWYKGADNITLGTIFLNLPTGIKNAYSIFVHYFLYPDSYYIFYPIRILVLVILFILTIVLPILKKTKLKNIIFYEIIVLLIPIACCICYLLTPSAEELQMQMTAPLVLLIPLILFYLSDRTNVTLVIVFGCIMLYGNVYAVGTDIDALALGNASSKEIMSSIINDLFDENLYTESYKYAFIGEISESPLFKVNENWSNSSYYAHFGLTSTKPSCVVDSYNGLIDDLGINGLNLVWGEEYETLLDADYIDEMPCYPYKGSIIKKKDVVIIKVSNQYEYNQ